MDKHSYLSNVNSVWVDDQYQKFIKEPASVEPSWQKFFEGFEFARTQYGENGAVPEEFEKEFKVLDLINGYRQRGHLFTDTNPVRERRKYDPTLAVSNFGLSEGDFNTAFEAGNEIGIGKATLRNIIDHLETTYCGSIGVEYRYIRKPKKQKWLQERMEGSRNMPEFSIEAKKGILRKLNQAVVFEHFLGTKFVGQKRFSIEGAEALIPALDVIIEHGADKHNIESFFIGMAHRGRLNVLANTLNKTYKDIFSEFESKEYEDAFFDGDVKYHLGFQSQITTNNDKKVYVTLAPNPSHLESVGPVVQGITRAIIDSGYDGDSSRVAPILIHGDAAIAAQGVVYEVVQMAKLKAYTTGGTIHIVVNNQVGFTTNYLDARSSTYCTDVAKVTLSPVFHVNGDDVEALAYTIKLAMDFRQEFKQDVFIDLLCYRKHGHNEGDEPKFTQPLLYKAIAEHANPREIYKKKLMESGVIGEGLVQEMEKEFQEQLQERLTESKQIEKATITSFSAIRWKDFKAPTLKDLETSPNTGVPIKTLKAIGKKLALVPKGMKFFKKLERILQNRQTMMDKDKLDWSMGELLAYGSILLDGNAIRFTGQDSERGTFSHRHAVVRVEDSEEEYVHLSHLAKDQPKFQIYNALLSEYADMGFDYGYALAEPNTLTIWEAQFGDFSNGAQIIIDQYLAAAEDKWNTMNGLVLLLPHGYEGMGAEHSSARMERYLALCAESNMFVVNCTTPANFFHVLRRQMARNFRKPLVVFTPKSLLRHPMVVSELRDMSTGCFQEVIDDHTAIAKKVRTVAFCQGKIYYELMQKKKELGVEEVAIVRLEQLHPFPIKQIEAILLKYDKIEEKIWVQEEPWNMGAWAYLLTTWRRNDLRFVGRSASGSPASGSQRRFEIRQNKIIDSVFQRYTEKVKL